MAPPLTLFLDVYTAHLQPYSSYMDHNGPPRHSKQVPWCCTGPSQWAKDPPPLTRAVMLCKRRNQDAFCMVFNPELAPKLHPHLPGGVHGSRPTATVPYSHSMIYSRIAIYLPSPSLELPDTWARTTPKPISYQDKYITKNPLNNIL